jgi:hypothetical protein
MIILSIYMYGAMCLKYASGAESFVQAVSFTIFKDANHWTAVFPFDPYAYRYNYIRFFIFIVLIRKYWEFKNALDSYWGLQICSHHIYVWWNYILPRHIWCKCSSSFWSKGIIKSYCKCIWWNCVCFHFSSFNFRNSLPYPSLEWYKANVLL